MTEPEELRDAIVRVLRDADDAGEPLHYAEEIADALLASGVGQRMIRDYMLAALAERGYLLVEGGASAWYASATTELGGCYAATMDEAIAAAYAAQEQAS